jgi:hypothetical protein
MFASPPLPWKFPHSSVCRERERERERGRRRSGDVCFLGIHITDKISHLHHIRNTLFFPMS